MEIGWRILVGMSLADLVSSMAYVVGKAAFPDDQGGRGTQATCQAQGFIFKSAQLSILDAWHGIIACTFAGKSKKRI